MGTTGLPDAQAAAMDRIRTHNKGGSMEIIRHEEPPVYTAPGLIGTVRLRAIVGDEQTEQRGVFLERFDPGARNRPHTHNFDQVLYILDGEGIVATDTEEHRAYLGDLVVVPAGEQHWHGATADTAMAHLAFVLPGNA
jgi:quercetin dioxygenase-like cupin family protein